MSIKLLQRVLSRVRGVDVLVVVFDEMPVRLSPLREEVRRVFRSSLRCGVSLDVKMKSSVKVAGLQLADLVAGFAREYG